MRRAAALAATGAVLAVLVAGVYWWQARPGEGPADAAVRVVTPERRTVASSVLATGVVRLRVGAEVRVGSQVSGIVRELNVTVGSHIDRGAVIARIDSRGIEARLAQARAQIDVIEQDVARARVELARVQRLEEQRLVAESEVEDRELALAEATARLEKARRDAAVVETELGYAVIRAPIAGTVASVTTQEGETVAASFTTPTFVTIIGDDALQLVAMVDETDIGGVAPGNPVGFTVEAFPAEEFRGHVERVAPKGTIISGVVNYEVMIGIDGSAELLKPDMTANVTIETAQREALVVPNEAVLREEGTRYVLVQTEAGAERREVVVGARAGGVTEIRRGLAPTERVLVGAVRQEN
ncbi:MAG TPA: efflux RND transporter periplasmic adaptor subunit [Steroidobacteraceae bacterium]|nr:efflux RND transporter periplasmic adaptor subunit [Steroidobacteraceae bacterium]HNS27413.1 efflux RND transporter periplasmic adaptor subunit [Steroidobacteraceae bacterium]